ncbi:hypothetical protein HZA45_02270, partial [Candidatus Peregrinibacteria bacterium]|nr:hypothetical protein [Candidatus Peregrinibacteria bacterium]
MTLLPQDIGNMDDLRRQKERMSGAAAPEATTEEKTAYIRTILARLNYDHLSRADKGLVRHFLQTATGYSRAHVQRQIEQYHHLSAESDVVSALSPARTFVIPRLSHRHASLILTLAALAIAGSATHRLPAALTARVWSSGSAAVRFHLAKTVVPVAASQSGITTDMILSARVRERRLQRLQARAHDNDTAPSGAVTGGSSNLTASLNSGFDTLATGKDGQVLMVQNGRPIWVTPPSALRPSAGIENSGAGRRPASEGGTRTYGGGGGGGGGGSTTITNITNGIVQADADGRYVNVGGDTVAGQLSIEASGIALRVTGTTSGKMLHTEQGITSSGGLVLEGTLSGATIGGFGLPSGGCTGSANKLVWDASTQKFACAADQTVGSGLSQTTGDERYLKQSGGTLTGALTVRVTSGVYSTLGLEVENTLSGAVIRASQTLASSGGLVFEGAGSGASLTVSTAFDGAGLSDCDTAGTSKLLWDATTKRFSCGTDQNSGGGTTFGSGQVLNIGDARYLRQSGGTLTGALTINVTNGNRATLDLEVTHLLSGSVIRAQDTLASSGTLVFEGAGSGASLTVSTSLEGAGLTDCDTAGSSKLLWDTTTKRFSCGTDTDTDTNTTYTAGQGLTLTATSFKVNATLTGTTLKFATTSGSIIHADNELRSSGTLVINGAVTFKSTLAVTSTSIFSNNITLRGRLSGSILHADNQLRSSGSLIVEGNMSGATLEGANLTDCDTAGTSKLLWDATTKKFSCGSDQNSGGGTTFGSGQVLSIGDARYVNTSGDTMTGALTIRVTGATRMSLAAEVETLLSGSILRAQDTLASSGTLVFEGAGSGSVLTVSGQFDGVGLTDCDGATQTLAWDTTTKRFSCGTDSDTTYTAGQGLTLTATAFS